MSSRANKSAFDTLYSRNICVATLSGLGPNFVSGTVEAKLIPPVNFLESVTFGGHWFKRIPTVSNSVSNILRWRLKPSLPASNSVIISMLKRSYHQIRVLLWAMRILPLLLLHPSTIRRYVLAMTMMAIIMASSYVACVYGYCCCLWYAIFVICGVCIVGFVAYPNGIPDIKKLMTTVVVIPVEHWCLCNAITKTMAWRSKNLL